MRIASNKYSDVIHFFREELKDLYEKGEIETFIAYCFEEFLHVKKAQLLLKNSKTMSESEMLMFTSAIKELKNHRPIQYILGTADFYGMKFIVNENVLIPRPETEELVELIKSHQSSVISHPSILDIGTGSGCIAIALKKLFPEANVSALDVSAKALEVARQNAEFNQTDVNFILADLFTFKEMKVPSFDIIVSNPPYILKSEMNSMSKNVTEHEPFLALFVENEDALYFYKGIADLAKKQLRSNGRLYFEIHESLGKGVKELLEAKGFKNVEVKKDMSGKDRMVSASVF